MINIKAKSEIIELEIIYIYIIIIRQCICVLIQKH